MDGPGRHPGARTKMPRMCGDVHRTGNRNRALGVNRSVPAGAAYEPVRGIAFIPCGKTRAPLRGAREAVILAYCATEVAEVVPGTPLCSLYI
jgi:hypothetical protein